MGDEMVDRLYDEYVAAYRAGDFDPAPFTSKVEGEDRTELVNLIELFVDQEPPTVFDPEAYRNSFSSKMSNEVAASLSGTSGQLPMMLVRLRTKNRILVNEVETKLALALGAHGEFEQDQVRDYYHQLEYGTLPAQPVSDQVFEALANIYRTSAGKLRAAGEALGPQPDHFGGPVYARVAGTEPASAQASMSFDSALESSLADEESENAVAGKLRQLHSRKRTWIDDLFLGDSIYG